MAAGITETDPARLNRASYVVASDGPCPLRLEFDALLECQPGPGQGDLFSPSKICNDWRFLCGLQLIEAQSLVLLHFIAERVNGERQFGRQFRLRVGRA